MGTSLQTCRYPGQCLPSGTPVRDSVKNRSQLWPLGLLLYPGLAALTLQLPSSGSQMPGQLHRSKRSIHWVPDRPLETRGYLHTCWLLLLHQKPAGSMEAELSVGIWAVVEVRHHCSRHGGVCWGEETEVRPGTAHTREGLLSPPNTPCRTLNCLMPSQGPESSSRSLIIILTL